MAVVADLQYMGLCGSRPRSQDGFVSVDTARRSTDCMAPRRGAVGGTPTTRYAKTSTGLHAFKVLGEPSRRSRHRSRRPDRDEPEPTFEFEPAARSCSSWRRSLACRFTIDVAQACLTTWESPDLERVRLISSLFLSRRTGAVVLLASNDGGMVSALRGDPPRTGAWLAWFGRGRGRSWGLTGP